MYGAVAATEVVVYYASKSLTKKRCFIYKHRQKAPMGSGDTQLSGRVLLL